MLTETSAAKGSH